MDADTIVKIVVALIAAAGTIIAAYLGLQATRRSGDNTPNAENEDLIPADGTEPDEQSTEALKPEKPPTQTGAGNEEKPPERSIEIALDRTHNFSGGEARVSTIAYLLLRAKVKGMIPVQFHAESDALKTAKTKLAELEAEVDRSPDQEEEFRHLLEVKDGIDDRLQAFQKALDLAINNDSFGKGTYLSVEDRLKQFLLGLRDQVFGRGTPLLPGIANPDWYTEVSQRQHTWFVRWNGEEDMSTTMDIDDAANDYLTRHRGEAEGAYVLDLDTFYRIALPAIAVYLVKYRFRDTKNHIPATIFDFERWSLSPS